MSIYGIAPMQSRTLGGRSHPGTKITGRRYDGKTVAAHDFSEIPATDQIFRLVEDYSADPTGTLDSTDAFRKAAAAAGAWATANPGNRAWVVNDAPEAYYKVNRTGNMFFRAYKKTSGGWYEGAEADGAFDAFFTAANGHGGIRPVYGVPDDELYDVDDYAVDRYTGDLYHKTGATTWELVGRTLAFDYEIIRESPSPSVRMSCFPPSTHWGEVGDFWVLCVVHDAGANGIPDQWGNECFTDSGNLSAAVPLCQAHNNITFYNPPGYTGIIRHYAFGGMDPDDYENDVGSSNLGEAIPQNTWAFLRDDGLWWTSPDGTETATGFQCRGSASLGGKTDLVISTKIGVASNMYITSTSPDAVSTTRGWCFYITSDGSHTTGTDLTGHHFDGWEIDGLAATTANHGWYSFAQKLSEWDTNQKCIVQSFGNAGDVLDGEIRDCYLHHYYGEIIYSGGANLKELLIQDTVAAHCNSSAISCGGQTTLTRVTTHHATNGVENYGEADDDHFLVATDCVFDARNPTTGYVEGANGVVWIGESGTTYMTATDCYFYGGGMGVFLANFANTVTCLRCHFYNQSIAGFRPHNQGDYAAINPKSFNDLVLTNCVWYATTRDVAACISYISDWESTGWIVNNPQLVEENGYTIGTFLYDLCAAPGGSGHDVTINNGDISEATYSRNSYIQATTGFPPTWNSVTVSEDNYSITSHTLGRRVVYFGSPEYRIQALPAGSSSPTQGGDSVDMMVANRGNFPTGHTTLVHLNLGANLTRKLWLISAATDATSGAWNNLTENIEVSHGDDFVLVKNANGKFDVTYYPGGI